MNYLQSILISGGSKDSRDQKLKAILKTIGINKLDNNPSIGQISPDEEKLSIGIDQIRQLRSALAIQGKNQEPKVAIISEAETLTTEAQNALLKTLEEPPENVYLILLAKNVQLLLPTVVSRCQVLTLSEKDPNTISSDKKLAEILEWMSQENIARGFSWAKENTDRKTAIATVDQLLLICHENKKFIPLASRLFEAKKFLKASTNVRLTLENLFLS